MEVNMPREKGLLPMGIPACICTNRKILHKTKTEKYIFSANNNSYKVLTEP